MKKIFKMANAELSKIFMRPSMFILATVLIIALVLSYSFFKPTQNTQNYHSDQISSYYINLDYIQKYEQWKDELVKTKTDIF